MSVLELDRVSHSYGRIRALDGVSLTVDPGEIVCLLGPSGCGKSTLLRLTAGLEQIQSGEIRIGGRRVAAPGAESVPPDARGVGFMFQDYALFPHLDVLENVGFGLGGLSSRARRETAMAALARVSMEGYAEAYPHTLSGGQQQRVALARALAPAPRLLLLDEPFSGLDARLRHRLAEQTWRLLKETDTATIVVTHDPEEGLYLGDRVGILREGRLEQIDTPVALYDRPRSAFVTNFLSDVNHLSGTVGDDGMVATRLGPVSAGAMAAGNRVEVLVRFEGVQLAGASGGAGIEAGTASAAGTLANTGVEAKVIRARPLGGWTLVVCTLGEGEAARTVYGRAAPGEIPEEGERVTLLLDQRHVFVFGADNAK